MLNCAYLDQRFLTTRSQTCLHWIQFGFAPKKVPHLVQHWEQDVVLDDLENPSEPDMVTVLDNLVGIDMELDVLEVLEDQEFVNEQVALQLDMEGWMADLSEPGKIVDEEGLVGLRGMLESA